MLFPEKILIQPLRSIAATVAPPGSKSYTNRALPIAALAAGTSKISGALFSDDTRHMTNALLALGIQVETFEQDNSFVVHGCAGNIPINTANLFIGNSGTTARFVAPMLALAAAQAPNRVYELDGVPAMRLRPMQPLLDALNQIGANAISIAGTGCPPIRVASNENTTGKLAGGTVAMRGDLTSQVFSGLLMSGPYMRNGLKIHVQGDLVSKPYMQLTAQTMQAFGATFSTNNYQSFDVRPGAYQATDYLVEPDASAASYFFAAAAILGGRVRVPGLGAGSLQGDLQFVRALEQMGCVVNQTDAYTEVIGTKNLRGIEINMADFSDTAQTLAVVAPFASSATRITGIGFIRRKETDRIAATVRELNKLGIDAREEEDGMLIYPGTPKPAEIETYEDHRVAMSFAVLGLRAGGVSILNPGCVAKTFPKFFEVIETLRNQ